MSKVRQISFDDTSFKIGQSCVTVVIDAEARRVIDAENGRDEQTVHVFPERLEAHGGDSTGIVADSSDMAKAYRAGIQFCFPNAKRTIDKIHVMKLMLDAMDEVRVQEQRQQKSKQLHLARRTLMIPQAKQTEVQKNRIIGNH